MIEADAFRNVGVRRHARWLAPLVFFAMTTGCPDGEDDDTPACVELDVEGCSPQYAPVFDQVYAETLAPRCSVAGASCHANPDALGGRDGFWFDTPERAHEVLLQPREGGAWVIPGDARCSPVMQRLESEDPFFVMPPGSQPMAPGVRCSIAQWIESGATR